MQADATGSNVLLRDDFSKLPAKWLTFPVAAITQKPAGSTGDSANSSLMSTYIQGPAIQENQWIDDRAHPHGAWSNGVVDQDAGDSAPARSC